MRNYRTTATTGLNPGAEVALTASQAAARQHALKPTGKRGVYLVTLRVEFKAGETFGYDGDLPKSMADDVTPLKGAEKASAEKAEKAEALKAKRAELDAALATLPGNEKDADYVVRAMRSHFGEVFTDADEKQVRDLVKPASEPASETGK